MATQSTDLFCLLHSYQRLLAIEEFATNIVPAIRPRISPELRGQQPGTEGPLRSLPSQVKTASTLTIDHIDELMDQLDDIRGAIAAPYWQPENVAILQEKFDHCKSQLNSFLDECYMDWMNRDVVMFEQSQKSARGLLDCMIGIVQSIRDRLIKHNSPSLVHSVRKTLQQIEGMQQIVSRLTLST